MARVKVAHPETGKTVTVTIPDDHDGSQIKVEFPDGATTLISGFDPAERALRAERPVVPCGNCGEPQTLVASDFVCSACGARNTIELHVAADVAEGSASQG